MPNATGKGYENNPRFQVSSNTDYRNTINLETIHCPVCMAQPKYCTGHDNDRNYPGVMVPRYLQSVRAFGVRGYGKFSDHPLTRLTADGERMILMEDFVYTDRSFNTWTATKGSILDGSSIPRAFWTLVGSPYRGKYRYASIVHDYYCVTRERKWRDVHRMFYEACLCSGCSEVHAKTLFYVVFHFGPRWGHVEMKLNSGGSHITSSDVVLVDEFVESEPSIKKIIEMHPLALGITRRYGRRGLMPAQEVNLSQDCLNGGM